MVKNTFFSYYEKFADGSEICIDEDIPFEIPSDWQYERMRNIFLINPKNNIDNEISVSFIPMSLIDDKYSGEYRYEIKNWKDCKKGFTHFASGDVAFAKISPCFENRKSVMFENLQNGYGAGTTELYVLRRFTEDILGKYLLYFIKSEYFISRGINTFAGVVGQQRIDKEYIFNTLFPIPPLHIQKLIVKQIQSVMENLVKIEASLS